MGLVFSQTVTGPTSNTVDWLAYDVQGASAMDSSTATVTESPTDVSLIEVGSDASLALWPAIALTLFVAFVALAALKRRKQRI